MLCGYKTSSYVSWPAVRLVPRCAQDNVIYQPAAVPRDVPTPSLVSVLSVSSPFVMSHSHIPSEHHTDASLSTEQLLGELRSYLRDRTIP